MKRVMLQPAPNQVLMAPDHPSGHRCGACTVFHEPVLVSRCLTWFGARRRAAYLNDWSLHAGYFYVDGDGDVPEWFLADLRRPRSFPSTDSVG